MEFGLVEIVPCSGTLIVPRYRPPKKIATLGRCRSCAPAAKRKLIKPRTRLATNWRQIHGNNLTPLHQNSLSLPRPHRHSRFQTACPAKSFRLHPPALHRLGAQSILHRLNLKNARRHMEHHLANEMPPTVQSIHQNALHLT